MKRTRSVRFLGCLVATLLLASAAVRAELNRWDPLGPPPPAYASRYLATVNGIAFAADGTLFAADSFELTKSSGNGSWASVLNVPTFDLNVPAYSPFLSVIVLPGSPETFLAGFAGGAVYRSTDAGATWARVLLGVRFLSMAGSPSSSSIVYAAMQLNQSAATYKSSDGGATWTALPALGVSPVYALVVDPTSSDVVYGFVGASSAGLPSGVYRSADGGSTWSRLGGGLPDDAYAALAIDPVSPATVYAGSSQNGLFRSDDGGGSWLAVNAGLRSLAVSELVIDPAAPSTLYAGTASGVYRSSDRGAHWSAIGFHQQTITALALDPASPSTIYAGVLGGIGRITVGPQQPCVAGPETLCLNGGRFRVETVWRGTSPGSGGAGQASAITGDTGDFWFFDAANIELVVKVLDGGAVNGEFWVFSGALSNVEYMITVTDTQTGLIQSYLNPQDTLASIADTEAFPGASAETSRIPAAPVARAAAPAGLCVPDGQTLCQLGGRFQVRVDWQGTPTGPTQHAAAVPLTDDTGYFWFFDAANVELVVKTLDGTAFNGHYWVFYGALSNVQYTIRVTDLQTGAVKTYENPYPFRWLTSAADTAAF
ncbi:MAG TPA: hypothetical protein VN032_02225 [Thermoanaerobaculia bacterium]|nr:hypothetical protein [Thermoanaerobaculia bacterium]